MASLSASFLTAGPLRILLLDREAYSSSVLLGELHDKGFSSVVHLADVSRLPSVLADDPPDVVVFNYHFHHTDSLADCSEIKRLAPQTAILAVASAGPAMKAVRAWARDSKLIDVVVEKPLSDERFFVVLRDLASARRSARVQQDRMDRLSRIVPEAALEVLDAAGADRAMRFEAAIVFTDIRRSTPLATTLGPEEYFALLNRSLSAQARVVERFKGSVIKFTGDGLMAMFKGMGRSYLALRCGLELAVDASQRDLAYGIGVAQGLVLAGFIGDSHQLGNRRQYDVVGATAHLAARLCSSAQGGEVLVPTSLLAAAGLRSLTHRPVGPLSLRGMDAPVPCVALNGQSYTTLTQTFSS